MNFFHSLYHSPPAPIRITPFTSRIMIPIAGRDLNDRIGRTLVCLPLQRPQLIYCALVFFSIPSPRPVTQSSTRWPSASLHFCNGARTIQMRRRVIDNMYCMHMCIYVATRSVCDKPASMPTHHQDQHAQQHNVSFILSYLLAALLLPRTFHFFHFSSMSLFVHETGNQ